MGIPVSPALAHKAHRENLWLDEARESAAGELAFGFRLPARRPAPTFSDYVEIQRQAGLAFSHLQLDVPMDRVSLLSSVSTGLVPDAARAAPRAGEVSVRAEETTLQGGRVTGVLLAVRFAAEGRTIGEGRIAGRFLPRKLYERLRSPREPGAPGAPAAPVAGASVAPAGLAVPRGARSFDEPLRVDAADPILSDHDSDHVSGMAVVCAVDRIVRERFPGSALSRLSTEFLAYIEKAPAARVAVEVEGESFTARVTQAGAACAIVRGGLAGVAEGAVA